MKKLKFLILLFVSFAFTSISFGQINFPGQGSGSFGGPVTNGSLDISYDDDNIYIQFNRGTSDTFNDVMVLYVDSEEGGFTGTSGFGDTGNGGDGQRIAVSSINVDLNFPAGFEANYGIALEADGSNVFLLQEGGEGFSLGFVETVLEFGTERTNAETSYTMTISRASLGFGANDAIAFDFVGTYLNPFGGNADRGFLSGEGFGGGLPTEGNIGDSGSFTFTSAESYAPVVPSEITLTEPTNNATEIALQPNFDWEADNDADDYIIQVATDSEFGDIVINETVEEEPGFSPDSDLTTGQEYFWRVRGVSEDGAGPWSTTWSFTTLEMSDVEQIVLTAPVDNATSVELQPEFSWQVDPEANTYQIQVSLNDEFTSNVINESSIAETEFNPTGLLSMGTEYFWRVRGTDDIGNGPWSETRSFTVVEPTATFSGNGGTGFGGTVSGSTLKVWDDGDDIYFEFLRGPGSFGNTEGERDFFVIYIDNGSEGRNIIDVNINDQGDNNRRAISSAGDFASEITFPYGFNARYAISIGVDFGGIWEIPAEGVIGNDGLGFLTGVGQPVAGDDDSFTFSFASSFISGTNFSFLATYLNGTNGFTSDEGYGQGFPTDGNVGGGDLNFTSYFSYPSGNEVFQYTTTISGAAGWRMLSLPATSTVSDLASQNLVQGISGANDFYASDFPEEEFETEIGSNFFQYSTTNDWAAPANFDTELSSGTGFIWYFYDNDVGPSNELDFTLNVAGVERNENVVVARNTEADFTLIGNPFSGDLNASNVSGWGDLQSTAKVWNPAANEGAGTYEDVTTASAFTGFFVESAVNPTEPNITIPVSALSQASNPVDKSEITLYLNADNGSKTLSDHNAKIVFRDGATHDWDIYDASKLVPLRYEFATIGILGDRAGEERIKSIDSRPTDFDGAIDLPLALNTQNFSGTFTIGAELFDIPSDWNIKLTDHKTGNVTNLREAAYSFEYGTVQMAFSDDVLATPKLMSATDADTRFTVSISKGEVTSVGPDGERPQTLALRQNFPNPFNPTTVIRYDLPENAPVRLSVYDMLGRQVAVLVNETMNAGSHQVNFNASQLSSGMYMYRLEAGSKTLTRTMTLIK